MAAYEVLLEIFSPKWMSLKLFISAIFLNNVVYSSLECQNQCFLVQFNSYLPQIEHFDLLTTIVGSYPHLTLWEWFSRDNPATELFPSDFAMLNVCEGMSFFHSLLEESPLIKGIYPQEMVYNSRKLAEADPSSIKEGKSYSNDEEDDFKGIIIKNKNDEVNNIRRGFSFVEDTSKQKGSSRTIQQHLRGSRKTEISTGLLGEQLWERGFFGKGVKVAVFDTGLSPEHTHFDNVIERINWTNEESLDDGVGHGTFVSGVIAGADTKCPGFAPDVDLYVFRVFTDAQISYTSWFLDAFNYAIFIGIDVLNLSIGGPDTGDRPFIEKVWEMTANGITIVSAVGNDGPRYGTLNNPADQLDTIGVGAVTAAKTVAPFQSRGMTSWEVPFGHGRVKPDIQAYGQYVLGPMRDGSCKALSGTSVASPVIAGAIALLMSTVAPEKRLRGTVNPASMKQVLIEAAELLPDTNIFEQGAGLLNVMGSYEALQEYRPRASLFPAVLDFTDCPYMWPYCVQPFYAGAEPVIFNVTVLNGMGVTGIISGIQWTPSSESDAVLNIKVDYPSLLWPWSGYLGVIITVKEEYEDFSGLIEGVLKLKVSSNYQNTVLMTDLELPIKAEVIPTPPREKRVIWDQFHNLKYPSGYVPRDNLGNDRDMLDWNGDHLHTNYGALFNEIVNQGLYVETLSSDFTCFDASNYGALIVMDSEEEFYEEEISKLAEDIQKGLSVLIVADWYNEDFLKNVEFFDDNTRCLWKPITGGANLPALNALLAPFDIAFGSRIFTGIQKSDIYGKMRISSGTSIVRAPAGASLLHAELEEELIIDEGTSSTTKDSGNPIKVTIPILVALDTSKTLETLGEGGKVVVHGDSTCFEASTGAQYLSCKKLLLSILDYMLEDDAVFAGLEEVNEEFIAVANEPPARLKENEMFKYSKVESTTVGSSCEWVNRAHNIR